jgi:hypothetical protein
MGEPKTKPNAHTEMPEGTIERYVLLICNSIQEERCQMTLSSSTLLRISVEHRVCVCVCAGNECRF